MSISISGHQEKVTARYLGHNSDYLLVVISTHDYLALIWLFTAINNPVKMTSRWHGAGAYPVLFAEICIDKISLITTASVLTGALSPFAGSERWRKP